jgi:hypothetical protein
MRPTRRRDETRFAGPPVQPTPADLGPGRRRAGRVRAVLGGAAAAWLAAQVLSMGLTVHPGAGPGSLYDLASTVAAIGWLAGVACALLAPVAAVLALAVPRLRGGGALISGLVGAAGGFVLVSLLAGNGMLPHLVGAVLGAVCGGVGWSACSWAGRSSARVVGLLVTAAGVWTAAILTV